MSTPRHNGKAIKVGTAEFSFSSGAKTRAETQVLGFQDIDNISAYTQSVSNDRMEHEGSYRGLKRIDEVFSIKQGLEYILKGDAFTYANLLLLLMGSSGTDHTQGALTASAGAAIAFTSPIPSVKTRWYDIYSAAGARLRSLTSVDFIAAGAPIAAQGESDDETFTKTGHGLLAGSRVVFSGTALPTGITAGTIYYVITPTTDTFKVSLTLGGSAVNLTSDGTNCFYQPLLTADTDYEVDLVLARVRFLTAQSGSVTPVITAPAIADGDDLFMKGVKPLQQGTFDGYGRLVIFHQKTKLPFIDHQDFSCTVAVESIAEADGKKPTEYQLRVRVTSDEGNVGITQRAV